MARFKKEYFAGDNIGIILEDQIFVDKGNLISHVENPPKLMNTFGKLFWLSEKN